MPPSTPPVPHQISPIIPSIVQPQSLRGESIHQSTSRNIQNMQNTNSSPPEEDEIYCLEGEKAQIVVANSQAYQAVREKRRWDIELAVDKIEEGFLRGETDVYPVRVRQLGGSEWTVQRKYSDFEWLFKALKSAYPGELLPYFPSKTVLTALTTKLEFAKPSLCAAYFPLRLQQLNNFLLGLCGQATLVCSQQLRIFVSVSGEQFRRMKRNIELQMEELDETESSSINLVAFFERGLAWLSESALGQPEESARWGEVRARVAAYSDQLMGLFVKFHELVVAKEEETGWVGPQSEIDSVEVLKAKVLSGRQYNLLLTAAIEGRILRQLVEEFKRETQLQQQMAERDDLDKMIGYLSKLRGRETRLEKLRRRRDTFEQSFLRCFQGAEIGWRKLAGALEGEFRAIWGDYCGSMSRIWK